MVRSNGVGVFELLGPCQLPDPPSARLSNPKTWRTVPQPPSRARPDGWSPQVVDAIAGYGPVDQPGWRLEAACQDLPTELFFPIGHGPRAEAQVDQAKNICTGCPVRRPCLDYAMATNAQYGVFGGLAEDERRRVRRSLNRGYGLAPGHLEASA
jgi:WhiB family transcriptional regulator, redox-sensing transcriptional regulator